MARPGGDTSSWPMTIRTAAHPQHELEHLLFNRNSCNVCRGALAGKLGYRCEPCNFDVHCECLPDHRTLTRGPVQAPPRPPYAHHPPPSRPGSSHYTAPVAPPPPSRPGSSHYAAPAAPPPPRRPSSYAVPAPPPPYHQQPSAHHAPLFRPPQLSLSLSTNLDVPHHHQQQGGGQTPPSPQPPQYYPPPQPQQQSYLAQQQQSYGYYGRGAAEPDSYNYNHLQQQEYPTTNNYGGYVDDYSAARGIEDAYADDDGDDDDDDDDDDDY